MPKDQWKSVNAKNPESPNYSILNKLDDSVRGVDGKFEFKIVWPKRAGDNFQHWRQTSNPMEMKKPGVVGYEAITCPHTGNKWGGLE
jgi:hypothetical protein